MSQALRKITHTVSRTNTIVIFINQLREKVGVLFGSPETTPGGRALKFYSSVRLDVRRIGQAKEGTDVVGNQTRVKVIKNKVAPPFKQAEFDIVYGVGVNQEGCILDMAVDLSLVAKSGAWYYTEDGEKFAQGRAKACVYLEENPAYRDELYNKVMETIRGT